MCDTSEAPQCKHFLAGRCNRASCRFVHSSEGLNRGSGVQPAEPVPAGALETLPPQPGAWLQVEGRRAEVVRLGKRKLRVRFDDGSRQWVALEEVPAKSAARETPKPCVAPAVAARPGRALPPALALSEATCGHCGRRGHGARRCTFGLHTDERFLPCAAGCFPRWIIVPLRRAAPDFDAGAPVEGRVDVGLRCVSAALFRSQSLRRNCQVTLCFLGGSAPRIVEVSGALARGLRPDEAALAQRLRRVSDASGGATAAAATVAAALEAGRAAGGGDLVEAWSRSETRGLRSTAGDLLSAVRGAISASGAPPALLLLSENGRFIAEVCDEMRTQGASGGVVVLLGDDRGLEPEEEREVLAEAAARGSAVLRVSRGSNTLFASHAIVLVHHYLDRHVHDCVLRQPRAYVRSRGS